MNPMDFSYWFRVHTKTLCSLFGVFPLVSRTYKNSMFPFRSLPTGFAYIQRLYVPFSESSHQFRVHTRALCSLFGVFSPVSRTYKGSMFPFRSLLTGFAYIQRLYVPFSESSHQFRVHTRALCSLFGVFSPVSRTYKGSMFPFRSLLTSFAYIQGLYVPFSESSHQFRVHTRTLCSLFGVFPPS
ncbi:inorganic triphosphatase YgiF [Lederbergia galactosidilyticus]|nr:inorganic triphosphatase YgiF [Lederbergia galactosidilytica]